MRFRNLGFLAVAAVPLVMPDFALAKCNGCAGAVADACVQTPGCQIVNTNPPTKGTFTGCSPTVCFSCKKGNCTQTRVSGTVGGDRLNGVLKTGAATGGTSSSNAGNKPVNQTPTNQTPTRNTEPGTERVGGGRH